VLAGAEPESGKSWAISQDLRSGVDEPAASAS
jgi:hypothetical protein